MAPSPLSHLECLPCRLSGVSRGVKLGHPPGAHQLLQVGGQALAEEGKGRGVREWKGDGRKGKGRVLSENEYLHLEPFQS